MKKCLICVGDLDIPDFFELSLDDERFITLCDRHREIIAYQLSQLELASELNF